MLAIRLGVLVLASAACFASTACTHVYKVDPAPYDGYPDVAKRNLDVELRLTDEFSSYAWEISKMGDTFRMPLGEALSSNAEALSRALFSNVTVQRGGEDPAASPGRVDAVLTPTVTAVERAMGSWAFADMTTVLEVEWSLADRAGNLAWVQTIQGSGTANTGNVFTHHANAEKQAKAAIEELFTKSFEAMAAAPEIRALER